MKKAKTTLKKAKQITTPPPYPQNVDKDTCFFNPSNSSSVLLEKKSQNCLVVGRTQGKKSTKTNRFLEISGAVHFL